ncbi:MAG TPA: hypothetical protein VKU02_06075 [Gemmataceae bacterium]|nr:hypothetical protein [Gemmataceae bacterium]
MPLLDLNVVSTRSALPADVRALLREAARRIRYFRREHRVPGFVPSDYQSVYHALRALTTGDLIPGDQFCEWGSGFGVVTCLAAMLGFDARGIEIEMELADAAQELADDFGLSAEFVRGSFIPREGRAEAAAAGSFAWLTTDESSAYQQLGLGPDEFDLVFAYPWPDEERVTENWFEHSAAEGAMLLTYHGIENLRFRRKLGFCLSR